MTDRKYCAVVTGATRGIGYAIAERLLQDGVDVIVTGKSIDSGYPDGAVYYPVDFLDDSSIKAFIDYLKQKSVDILINNAGINKVSEFQDIEIEDFDSIQKVNLKTPILLCQAVIPYMKKNKLLQWAFLLTVLVLVL